MRFYEEFMKMKYLTKEKSRTIDSFMGCVLH